MACGGEGDSRDAGRRRDPSVPSILPASTGEQHRKDSSSFQWDEVKGATAYDYGLSQDGTLVKEAELDRRNAIWTAWRRLPRLCLHGLGRGRDYKSPVHHRWPKQQERKIPAIPARNSVAYEDFGIPEAEEDGIAKGLPGSGRRRNVRHRRPWRQGLSRDQPQRQRFRGLSSSTIAP